MTINIFQAYRHIFTSPSSASEEDIQAINITSRRRDVASTLGLNGQVTARSIAYTATQVCRILLHCCLLSEYLTFSTQAHFLNE